MTTNTEEKTHIAIIGAGIIGVCTALELQQLGYKVTLIDAKGVAEECSYGNAGHFATEHVFPLAEKSLLFQIPKMLLDPLGPFRLDWRYLNRALPWFYQFIKNMRSDAYRSNQRAIKSLNTQALKSYDRLLKLTNAEHFVRLSGGLLTYEHADTNKILKQRDRYLEQGVQVSFLTQAEAIAMEPNLSDKVQAALYFHDVGHTINPAGLGKHFASYFFENGGDLHIAKVSTLKPHENGVYLETSQGDLAFDRAIIAAGAWSQSLTKILGYEVPLDTERGYHLMLPNKELFSRPVTSDERKFIMTPMEEGLRLAGTVEFAGLNKAPNYKRAEVLLSHAKQLIRDTELSSNSDYPKWMGFRPSLPDSLPVIGQAPRHENIFFAFGHQHLGLTWAAITAKLVGEIVSSRKTTIDISPFCMSRFTK